MNSESNLQIITAAEDPTLVNEHYHKVGHEWPEFMLHDPTAQLMDRLYTEFADFQFVLKDNSADEIKALGNAIPIYFEGALEDLPDKGWDWALSSGFENAAKGIAPNYLCAIQAVIFRPYRGQGISKHVIQGMRSLGEKAGLPELLAPIRPNRKCDYPLISIYDYVKWKREDGKPFDPWLRVHADLGAKLIKPCTQAMRIPGTIAEWTSWTEMYFPQSGDYVIPGALVPIQVDCANDLAVYVEPNVWMHHPACAE